MKKLILIFCLLVSLATRAQDNVQIILPEGYELANVILALTKYGVSDPYEVNKETRYYKDMMSYFAPVMNHPLLDSVNYSREKWDYFLAFRTDGAAFGFNKRGKFVRTSDFRSMEMDPLDKYLALVDDFARKSKFRGFYTKHKPFYDSLITNYKSYYLMDKTVEFLDKNVGRPQNYNDSTRYLIVISPLVGRMNCHRKFDKNTVADFASLGANIIKGNIGEDFMTSRVMDNHTIFTEMDHGYVNPITSKYMDVVKKNWDNRFWDQKSGYTNGDVFNEYMTWAVYDLFVHQVYPAQADSICGLWHVQNVSRGFIASDLFAGKVMELYNAQKNNKLDGIYPSLLEWCAKIGPTIVQPLVTGKGSTSKNVVGITHDKTIEINFTEPMDENMDKFSVRIHETVDGKSTGENYLTTIERQDNEIAVINGGKTLLFRAEIPYKEYILQLNNWVSYPLHGANGVMVKPGSLVFCKKLDL